MKPTRFACLLPLVLLLASGLSVPAASQQFPAPPGGAFDFTARQTGAWHDPLTWTTSPTGPIPGNSSRVKIPSAYVVTIQRVETARHRFLAVEGQLKLWIHSNTQLLVETLYVAPTGSFLIGNATNPVKPGFKADIVFTGGSAIDTTWDPKQLSRGLVADGVVKVFGLLKTHALTLTGDALKNATTLNLSSSAATAGWLAGDEIVVAGTYFQRTNAVTSSQDDRRTIQSVSGSQMTLTAGLTYDHVRAAPSDPTMKVHVVNLTRNLIFRSETPTLIRDRGHVMLKNRDLEIQNAAFRSLGRTDKSVRLNDFVVNQVASPATYNITTPAASAVTNPRGRYALHVHKNVLIRPIPAAPPSKVYGSVVVDTPGWGFVNHSSHVDFQRNVAYDFGGAGFVTEAGDELGNFLDNVAIRGRGNGQYRPVRIVFENPDRPQPLSDFAFSGDGFWFQGPAIRARNNVASGCDGAGMIWFTPGAPDLEQLYTASVGGSTFTHDRYTHFLRTDVAAVYGTLSGLNPRYWDHSATNEKLVISDLPILEMDGFDGYGNLVGFRVRFNNQSNIDWYKEDPYDFDVHVVQVCGTDNTCAGRVRQAIKNVRLWNNEQAFNVRYNTKTDWTTVKAVNRLAYKDNKTVNPDLYVGHAGAEINFQILDSKFTGLSIDGYPVAGWIENDNTNVRNQITFVNPPVYANYANFDIWNRSLDTSCGTPINPFHSLVTSSTARLTWSPGSSNSRYLVRTKATNKQPWTMLQATASPVNLSGLSPATTYEYQVLAGCTIGASQGLSLWTLAGTFTTAP